MSDDNNWQCYGHYWVGYFSPFSNIGWEFEFEGNDTWGLM